jgi:hypothetical protein
MSVQPLKDLVSFWHWLAGKADGKTDFFPKNKTSLLNRISKPLRINKIWLRGVDLNHRPLGYEPNELPDCSTPHFNHKQCLLHRQTWATNGLVA